MKIYEKKKGNVNKTICKLQNKCKHLVNDMYQVAATKRPDKFFGASPPPWFNIAATILENKL